MNLVSCSERLFDQGTYHTIATLALAVEAYIPTDEGGTADERSALTTSELCPSNVRNSRAIRLNGAHHCEERDNDDGKAGEHVVEKM